MRKISETLVVSFDSSDGKDRAELSVVRMDGSHMTYLRTFFDEEAEWMYSRLSNSSNMVTKADLSSAISSMMKLYKEKFEREYNHEQIRKKKKIH